MSSRYVVRWLYSGRIARRETNLQGRGLRRPAQQDPQLPRNPHGGDSAASRVSQSAGVSHQDISQAHSADPQLHPFTAHQTSDPFQDALPFRFASGARPAAEAAHFRSGQANGLPRSAGAPIVGLAATSPCLADISLSVWHDPADEPLCEVVGFTSPSCRPLAPFEGKIEEPILTAAIRLLVRAGRQHKRHAQPHYRRGPLLPTSRTTAGSTCTSPQRVT